MSAKTMFTVEQFLELPDEERDGYELEEGELIPVANTTPEHNLGRDRLNRLWFSFLERTKLGMVISESSFRLPGQNWRQPDIVFYATERWKSVDPRKTPIELPPDIAVEFISTNETAREVTRKVNLYFKAGVREVWLIYLSEQQVDVCRFGAIRVLYPGDALESPEILPGFSIPVKDLFENLATV